MQEYIGSETLTPSLYFGFMGILLLPAYPCWYILHKQCKIDIDTMHSREHKSQDRSLTSNISFESEEAPCQSQRSQIDTLEAYEIREQARSLSIRSAAIEYSNDDEVESKPLVGRSTTVNTSTSGVQERSVKQIIQDYWWLWICVAVSSASCWGISLA